LITSPLLFPKVTMHRLADEPLKNITRKPQKYVLLA